MRAQWLWCVVALSGCVGVVSEKDAGSETFDAGEVVDDADVPDAGMPDAGPVCASGNWCEDFETGGDAGWTSQVNEDGGLFIATPPNGSLSPGHALRIEVERGRATMQLAPDQFFADAGYHVFGRALFFGERMPGDMESKRHGWVTLEGTSPMHGSYSQVGFRHESGRTPFGNFFVINPWQDCWANGQPSAQATPVGRWFLLRVGIRRDRQRAAHVAGRRVDGRRHWHRFWLYRRHGVATVGDAVTTFGGHRALHV